MFLSDREDEIFQKRFPQALIMNALKVIEESRDAIASRGRGDRRHIGIYSPVGVMQFEFKLAARRNAGSKVAIASFDAAAVGVSREALPQQIRTGQFLT